MRVNRTESLLGGNSDLPSRESLREPPRTSEKCTANADQVTKGNLSEVFGGPLGDPLGGRFKMLLGDPRSCDSCCSSSCCP